MSSRKPRLTAIERILSRPEWCDRESTQRYAESHDMCPVHLRCLPCFKCEASS